MIINYYNLTGIGNPISSIVFIGAPKGKVLLQRSIDLLRDTDYQENGDLLADTLNRDFDRIYLAMQGSAQNTNQALRVADPEGVNVLPFRDAKANKLLSFDSQGQPSLSTIDSDSALGLASALADTIEKQKGAALVGFNDDLKYPQKTIGHAIQSIDQIAMFTTQWWPDRKAIPSGYVATD